MKILFQIQNTCDINVKISFVRVTESIIALVKLHKKPKEQQQQTWKLKLQ